MNWSGGKPVTLLRRDVTGQDVLGNDQYGTVESFTVTAILVPQQIKSPPRARRGSSPAEELQGEFMVAAGFTAYLPPGTPVRVTDEFIIDGETWRVAGVPGNYQSPWTQAAGCVQAELIRITG